MKINAAMKYNPEKGFWQGVPARDLTAEEWNAIDDETQKRLVEIGMYTAEGSPSQASRFTASSKTTKGDIE